MIFSFLWHGCGVDLCLTEKLGDMDVEFARWGMLTAVSYLVLEDFFHKIFPLNVALSVVFNAYDNWIPYALTGAAYLGALTAKCFVRPAQNVKYDSIDGPLAIFCG